MIAVGRRFRRRFLPRALLAHRARIVARSALTLKGKTTQHSIQCRNSVGHAPIVYEVRPRKDHRAVDLISDALPFSRLWYGDPNAVANAIGYAMHRSRSHDAMIRVYDDAGNGLDEADLYLGRVATQDWQ